MRPFGECVLNGMTSKSTAVSTQWIFDTPVHSEVEAKLRKLLIDLGDTGKILGIQVCAYKDGEVIIDTSAGVLGEDDPRPVQPDTLFPVFSATKGITAGLLHWVVDNRKVTYEESVANIWPEFASNNKDMIKVHHILNHTSGLHNALPDIMKDNPMSVCDWDDCLRKIAVSTPETEPGQQQLYHYLSFGWLCGGIIERASGKKFQEVLEEAFIHPLKIEGEMYIGIPPGVESRLATLTLDPDDLEKFSALTSLSDMPSSFPPSDAEVATSLPPLFNSLFIRRAIIPAANAHCSARALARYYASLADLETIIPKFTSSSLPPLGSHTHIPIFAPENPRRETNNGKKKNHPSPVSLRKAMTLDNIDDDHKKCYNAVPNEDSTDNINGENNQEEVKKSLFSNPRSHDAFMGVGEYGHLALLNGNFGLGFERKISIDGSILGFGHAGMGGSTGFCDPRSRFSIAVTMNQLSFGIGSVTGEIIHLVCSELNIPIPREFKVLEDRGPSS